MVLSHEGKIDETKSRNEWRRKNIDKGEGGRKEGDRKCLWVIIVSRWSGQARQTRLLRVWGCDCVVFCFLRLSQLSTLNSQHSLSRQDKNVTDRMRRRRKLSCREKKKFIRRISARYLQPNKPISSQVINMKVVQ